MLEADGLAPYLHSIVNNMRGLQEKTCSERGGRSVREAEERRGLDHGVGHFRPLSITRQRHLLAYHGTAMSHKGLCQVF